MSGAAFMFGGVWWFSAPPASNPTPPSFLFSSTNVIYDNLEAARRRGKSKETQRGEAEQREKERRTVRRKLGNKTTLEVRAYLNRLHQTCDYSCLLMKSMIKSAALDLRFFPVASQRERCPSDWDQNISWCWQKSQVVCGCLLFVVAQNSTTLSLSAGVCVFVLWWFTCTDCRNVEQREVRDSGWSV